MTAKEAACGTQERNAQMRALREAGWGLAAIGRRYGLSRQRVRQIVDGERLRQPRHLVSPLVLGPLAPRPWRRLA